MILLNVTRVLLYVILGILSYLGEVNSWSLPLLLLYDWQYFIRIRYDYFSGGGQKKLVPLEVGIAELLAEQAREKQKDNITWH